MQRLLALLPVLWARWRMLSKSPPEKPTPTAARITEPAHEPRPTPDFVGLATWYGNVDNVGRQTRSGEPYDPHTLTCAVPHELWDDLAGRLLRIQRMDSDSYVLVRVSDAGYLSEAGRFIWDVRRVGEQDVARWWPDEEGLPIVVDLTPAAHRFLSPDHDTVQVQVWVVQEQ